MAFVRLPPDCNANPSGTVKEVKSLPLQSQSKKDIPKGSM